MEKIAIKVILWICIITLWKITKNLHFANFHPLDQARPQFDINKTWSLWKYLSFAIKKSRISLRIKFYVHQKSKVLKWAWNWNPIMKCWYADLKNHNFSPTLLVKKLTLFSKRTNFSSRSPIFRGWLWPVGLTNFWFLDGKWKIFS